MYTEPEKQAAFWNARAKNFPAALSEQHREKMLRRLAHVPEAAYPRAGQRCLDIGAGTGVFSLWAAEQSAAVTAVDVSPGMLAELSTNAGERTVETVEAAWQQIDPKERGWENAFDTVFAQMVPGFRAAADFARMEACCRGWCVFIGWGHKREDPWLQAAFAAHDLPWQVPYGLPAALELLAALGRHPEPTWIEDSWTRTRPVAAAIEDASGHLSIRGVEPDRDRLAALAAEMYPGQDEISDAAEVEIGVIAWQPPSR